MTEHFSSRKGVASKLWPIVGYGAYVCAAIQIRCLLALGSLTTARLERCESLLHLIGELKEYWGNVSSLVSLVILLPLRGLAYPYNPQHAQADQQFAEARKFLKADKDFASEAQISSSDVVNAVVFPGTSISAHWRTSISTYIADEDDNNSSVHAQEDDLRLLQSREAPKSTEREMSANIGGNMTLPTQSLDPAGAPDTTQSWLMEQSTPSTGTLHENEYSQTHPPELNHAAWWEQVPDAFADVFGLDFYAANNGVVVDT